ncbi:MAG: M48 family metallopeptidase [Burkholderiales bacterium]|nr:MAG: M48 family metallopeptidase [Burkholderiales bacterium]
MTPLAFSILFALAIVAATLVRIWLAARQIRHVVRHRERVPEQFSATISLDAHRRAADYTVARTRLVFLDATVSAAFVLGMTLLGGFQWLYDLLFAALPEAPLLRQILLVLAVALAASVLELPFDWYRQFRIEARFGFNRMSLRLFVVDLLRGLAIAAVLGVPLLAAVLWLIERTGSAWWLWVWFLWMGFNLVVLVLYPTVIAPLFNRYEPLADEPLRKRLERLLARCGFEARGVFVMDGSRRSGHGNAYFTGLGAAKRIVLFDTLIERLDADEIEAVLAHEIGHFKRRHVVKRIALTFVLSLGGLWLLGYLGQQPWFYVGLGALPRDAHWGGLALVLFLLALPSFTFLLHPLAAALSRRQEFEADRFAAERTDAGMLIRALVKLYRDNASTLTPDPVHSRFYDSHPPASQRVGRLSLLQSITRTSPA